MFVANVCIQVSFSTLEVTAVVAACATCYLLPVPFDQLTIRDREYIWLLSGEKVQVAACNFSPQNKVDQVSCNTEEEKKLVQEKQQVTSGGLRSPVML